MRFGFDAGFSLNAPLSSSFTQILARSLMTPRPHSRGAIIEEQLDFTRILLEVFLDPWVELRAADRVRRWSGPSTVCAFSWLV